MPNIPIAILDNGPMEHGATPREGLARTVALARRVDELGYHRFWYAEHHGSGVTASATPPIVIARVAAATSRIRVGAGGVMLPNHSPLIVAEQFGTLHAFDPGRIDLGIGRGPGTKDPATVQALLNDRPALSSEQYADQVAALLGYFRGEGAGGVRVPSAESDVPQVWLLTSSDESAQLAAELGLPMSFAYHLRPDAADTAIAVYRDKFRPSVWLERPRVSISLIAICAETDEAAARVALPTTISRARVATGQENYLPTDAEAVRYEFSPEEEKAREQLATYHAIGSPQTVVRRAEELIDRFSLDELVVFTPVYDVAKCIRSYELLAEPLIGSAAPRGGAKSTA
ncbi:FMN-linked alkanal monooxygenase [Streptomyces sulfonofaciens]|uniref:FMN-linked alkanal monooxygenase n=1 Tax=Streptomyces sulfonofaciens TaxID=68272 RepID=A0A919KY43_9ACTN|nr:LLM class flavin-dependent oxidoreductase [Streptomyces sulfonofaciens]GHH76963.1 FMN-linked alkanal monooxygenase [Streptomyces sulfonofaciens]